MANPEHLKILKKGVEAWNKWRKENPDIQPDLSRADLTREDLRNIQLSRADLSESNLCNQMLRNANLWGANLFRANMFRADLAEAELSEANLNEAELSWSAINYATLFRSNLVKANLMKADLTLAKLAFSNLNSANLSSANLSEANLWHAYLKGANLEKTDLSYSNLVSAYLEDAVLTGAKLYGSSRDDWIIKGVECKYVYWDWAGEQRSPKDRDLEPGEFEKLYAQLPTIEYIFEKGMTPLDPLIMDRVVQAIREKRPEFDIKLDSINARGLAPSIKFTVQLEEHKKLALKEVKKVYEIKLKQLRSERDRYYELVSRAIDTPKEFKLISAGPGAIVATDGSTINIQQDIHNALELQKAIAKKPEDDKSFGKVAKRKALDIIGGVIEDIAKGQVKEAAKQIVELGKDLGPIIAKTAAYAFFKSVL